MSLNTKGIEVDSYPVVGIGWQADVHIAVYITRITSRPSRTSDSTIHLSEQAITV
jgi:hypothetical protein